MYWSELSLSSKGILECLEDFVGNKRTLTITKGLDFVGLDGTKYNVTDSVFEEIIKYSKLSEEKEVYKINIISETNNEIKLKLT